MIIDRQFWETEWFVERPLDAPRPTFAVELTDGVVTAAAGPLPWWLVTPVMFDELDYSNELGAQLEAQRAQYRPHEMRPMKAGQAWLVIEHVGPESPAFDEAVGVLGAELVGEQQVTDFVAWARTRDWHRSQSRAQIQEAWHRYRAERAEVDQTK